MSEIEIPGSPFRSDGQHTDQVQAEIGKVGQGLLAKRLVMQLRSDQSESTERSGARAKFCHGGRRQRQVRSDYDLLDLSPSGQEHGERATDIIGELAHGSSQLRGEDLIVRHTAAIKSFKCGELAGPEAGKLSVDVRNGSLLAV